MLGIPSAASINHLLRAAPWALEKLASHAGKIVAVKFGPIPLHFAIAANGELNVAEPGRDADVSVDIAPSLVLRAMTQGRAAFNDAAIGGDTAFAQDLAHIAQNLQWDYEEDLSKFVGDIVAHRIGSAARSASGWAKESTHSFLQMAKDFWTEERPTVAKSQDVAAFVAAVDELRDAAARLEKRIELLEKNARRS